MPIVKLGLVFGLLIVASPTSAAEMKLTIRSDYPGGNVIVVKNEAGAVQVVPDLRGGLPWFYWNFEASASQPGRVTFSFVGTQQIGVRGPAYSVDEGKSWRWLGAEQVVYAPLTGVPAQDKRETFTYDFTAEHPKVRFAVAIPYLPDDLKTFLAKHASNPNLKQQFLTKTRNGTPVELLQIGEAGAMRSALLVTARHHACESMASYVLEGFLQEAMSDSPAGIEFRKRYVLFAVPLVDRDGVQAGDQGKNRPPHDHNRDYGPLPIYPEIQAIQELGAAQQVKYALDFHCPALRGDIHEAFHFLGLGVPRVKENLDEYIAWIKEERPQAVMTPLNLLTDPQKPNAVNPKMNSHHFALRDGAVIAATLEVPYTQPEPALDPAMARSYGAGMLRAWTRTKFIVDDAASARGAAGNAELLAYRTTFGKLYRSKPDEAEAAARAYLEKESLPVYRVEANSQLALLRWTQRRYAEALEFAATAANDPQATMYQRSAAGVLRLQIMADDPRSTSEQIESELRSFLQLPYPAKDRQAKAFESAVQFFTSKQSYERAIELAHQQATVAAPYETGKVMNRIASLYDLAKRPAEAIVVRREAVELLRKRLGPVPQRSIFAAMMTLDLFDAVCGIPTSTLAEKQAAAKLVLDHEVVAAMYKDKVRKTLAELEKQ
ncbi:MAG: hypothetical protein K8U03_24870 [Planctomycetia bacterium]|nr:hypothetical protein [Planctomycetia bacterium]